MTDIQVTYYHGKLGTQPISFRTKDKITVGKVITYTDSHGQVGKAIIENIDGSLVFMARI